MVKKFNEMNESNSIFDCSLLDEYGNVEICEEVDDQYHILITGFSPNNSMQVFNILNNTDIIKDYPLIDKMNVDDDVFDLKLKKKE